jgi:hypothetical protein
VRPAAFIAGGVKLYITHFGSEPVISSVLSGLPIGLFNDLSAPEGSPVIGGMLPMG